DSVDLVDVSLGKVVKNLPIKAPHNCYNAGRNDRIYVTSMGEHLVRLIDVKSLRYAAEIPVGGVPRPLSVTRDEKTMDCALSDLHGFVIADLARRKVIDKVLLPALPAGVKFPVPTRRRTVWSCRPTRRSCGSPVAGPTRCTSTTPGARRWSARWAWARARTG